MDSSEKSDPLLPPGGYRQLRSYKVAEAVYDATVVFCQRFHPDDRRLTDQMVQAARSGVRNISEGSGVAATSRKSELKPTNVAPACLSDELLRDYESFLQQRGLRVWPKDSREALAMRARLAQDHADLPPGRPGAVRLTGLFGLAEFVEKAEPELVANAMICAVNQAAYLLKRQIQSQGQADSSDKKLCPNCGRPMILRTARKGKKAGQPFWGCSGYPDCKGTRPAESQ